MKPIPKFTFKVETIYAASGAQCYAEGKSCNVSELVKIPASKKIHLFGVSGGKDSGALALWALHESRLPHDEIVFTFSDTDNEHQATYDTIVALDKLHTVIWLIPPMGFFDLAMHKKMFPSRKRRFCTQFLKMMPAQRFAHELVNAGCDVTMYSGVRASESDDRAKLPKEEFDGFFGLQVIRPLLDWSLKDVFAIHEKYNLPLNPLYGLGVKRVGCFPCINSVKSELRVVREHSPETLNKIRSAEQGMETAGYGLATFFHRKTVPIRFRTKKITTRDGRQLLVCTIDDVIKWSEWLNKSEVKKLEQAKTREFKFTEDKFLACSSSYGSCE